MIPFASQRGGGQDLATHLMNAHDNEQIELAVGRRRRAAVGALRGPLQRCAAATAGEHQTQGRDDGIPPCHDQPT